MPIWDLLGDGRRPKRYAPGQMSYLQGEAPACFYYLQQGEARSFLSLDSGQERVLAVHHAGDLMGEASFFDRCPRVSSAMAVSPCLILPVDRQQLDAALLKHPELALPMLQYLARTVGRLSRQVGSASLPAPQRIARFLLEQPTADQSRLACTHEEIGQAVGASRVTVSRVLRQWSRAGIVRTGYGSLWLLDPDRLRQMAEPVPFA